jgi:sulfate adenylyltransferase subunit 1
MAILTALPFSVGDYLADEREKDLLRFSTAGSVDDGKSTLIGRLLYDTQSVYEDQVRSIEGKGTTAPGQIDFALLTDGLRAEREQGITIDVAYRYFSTPRRKFIIADTPGHEQYTRNMATGASTADAAVVLIDASKGVLIQSRRHAYIASLLRVRHVIVAVNKMDLIGYDEAAFRAIELDFTSVLNQIAADTGSPVEVRFVPVSALAGDNIVHRSDAMPWYKGPSLLELLESLPSALETRAAPFRFPVQRVLRPDHTFRGFAGQVASGTVRPGDKITVLPSGRSAEVARIVTFDGDLNEAIAPQSVTLVLDRETRHQPRRSDRRHASAGNGRQAPSGSARLDGCAAASAQSPLSSQAHQPDRSRIRFIH